MSESSLVISMRYFRHHTTNHCLVSTGTRWSCCGVWSNHSCRITQCRGQGVISCATYVRNTACDYSLCSLLMSSSHLIFICRAVSCSPLCFTEHDKRTVACSAMKEKGWPFADSSMYPTQVYIAFLLRTLRRSVGWVYGGRE